MSDSKRNESFLPAQGVSDTAASAHNRLYGDSGAMPYRVTVQSGMGRAFADITAATGDAAADMALAQFPGAKVLHIEPAPQPVKRAA